MNFRDDRRARLYESYASTHSGTTKTAAGEKRVFDRDIAPHLPTSGRDDCRIVDLGCGQGRLVQQLIANGYANARGVDISPEQVEIAHSAGIISVECGDYRDVLGRESGALSAVIATDFLEHFAKDEVPAIFDEVQKSLRPGGVFIARSPNATSPFFGNYQFSDFTHETVLTPRSFSQLAASSGFARSSAFPCTPAVHGARSAVRAAVWWAVAGALRVALTAETGAANHIVTQNFIGVAAA